MAEILISEFIDREGIKADTDFFIKELNRCEKGFENLQKSMRSLSTITGPKQLANVTKEAASAQAQLEQSTKALLAAQQALTVTETKAATARKENAQAALAEARAVNESAKAKKAEQKERETAVKASAAEQKAIEAVANDYKQLSLAYNEAALRAKNMAIRFGENHLLAVQAAADANNLGNYLKRVDATVGQFGRSVGHYSTALSGLRLQTAQLLREAPALAISAQTFILALSNNLPLFFDAISAVKKENLELAASGQKTTSAFAQVIKSLFSLQSILTIGVTLVTIFSTKIIEFVSNLFKSADATERARAEIEALGKSAQQTGKEVDQLVKSLQHIQQLGKLNLDISFGSGFKSDLLDLSAQNIEIDEMISTFTQKQGKLYNEYGKAVSLLSSLEGGVDWFGDPLPMSEDVKKAQATADAILAEHDRLGEKINDANKQRTINKKLIDLAEIKEQQRLNDLAEKDAEERAAKAKELRERERQAIYQLGVLKIQDELELQKANAQNIALPENIRINAREAQLEKEMELIKLKQNFELNEEGRTVNEIALINKNALNSRKEAETTAFVESVAIRKSAMEREKQNIDELNEYIQQQLDKQTGDETTGLQKSLSNKLKGYQDETNALIQIELERYTAGTITKEQYETRKQSIENEFRKKSLQAEITYYKSLIEISNLSPDKKAEALQKLADLEQRFFDLSVKANEEANVKKNVSDKKLEEQKKQRLEQLGNELREVAFTFLTAELDREKNQINEQVDALEKKRQKDIETSNQAIANTQERAAAIAVIEARANAEREQLERRKRQVDTERARYDRLKNIADVIQNTAVAVVKSLAATPPPAGIGLAALVAAIGAAQLVRLLATPLPKFKHGKNVHDAYEGPAIVGDGGKSELHIREDGSMSVTPNYPIYTYVKKRDIILPDAKKFFESGPKSQMNKVLSNSDPSFNVSPTFDDKLILQGLKSIENTVRNKRESHIVVNDIQKAWIKTGYTTTEFLNRWRG